MKKILYVALGIVLIALCIKILHNDYNEAVNDCVNGGNSYDYCVSVLG